MPNFNRKISDTNVRIGETRFSFANVFEPKAPMGGGDPKYSLCIIIPKSNKQAIKLVQEAIEAAKQQGKSSKWGGKIPPNCKSPLRDGDIDRPEDVAFKDCYFINASTKNKPGVMVLDGGYRSEAMGVEDFYSGCYGAVTINLFAYDSAGNRGVGAGLNNVIKTRDGQRLAGGRSADEDFSDLDDLDELG